MTSPQNASTSGTPQDQQRIRQVEAQVNEVVGVMRNNVALMLERDQKLSELDLRADALEQGAHQFERQAVSLKRKFWWQNLKMMIILIIVVVICAIVIGLAIWGGGNGGSKNDDSSPPQETAVAYEQPQNSSIIQEPAKLPV